MEQHRKVGSLPDNQKSPGPPLCKYRKQPGLQVRNYILSSAENAISGRRLSLSLSINISGPDFIEYHRDYTLHLHRRYLLSSRDSFEKNKLKLLKCQGNINYTFTWV